MYDPRTALVDPGRVHVWQQLLVHIVFKRLLLHMRYYRRGPLPPVVLDGVASTRRHLTAAPQPAALRTDIAVALVCWKRLVITHIPILVVLLFVVIFSALRT